MLRKEFGGAMRDRTADLLRAKQALSQLSYSPTSDNTVKNQIFMGGRFGGAKRDRTADLLHAMQALSQLSYSPVSTLYRVNGSHDMQRPQPCQRQNPFIRSTAEKAVKVVQQWHHTGKCPLLSGVKTPPIKLQKKRPRQARVFVNNRLVRSDYC